MKKGELAGMRELWEDKNENLEKKKRSNLKRGEDGVKKTESWVREKQRKH